MRHFDLSPLYRSTVGFDRLFSMLDALPSGEASTPGYPPYNIERTAENEYRITMAVAGYSADDLDVSVKDGVLTISGKSEPADDAATYLHRGIARDRFEPHATVHKAR